MQVIEVIVKQLDLKKVKIARQPVSNVSFFH